MLRGPFWALLLRFTVSKGSEGTLSHAEQRPYWIPAGSSFDIGLLVPFINFTWAVAGRESARV